MSSESGSSAAYHAVPNGRNEGNGVQRAIQQRGQQAMVMATLVFILLSTIFSFLPAGTSNLGKGAGNVGGPLPLSGINPMERNRAVFASVTAGTGAKPLSWAERNDRTWSDDKCREEFPLLYPQLEQVSSYWMERGGLNRSILDMNEKSTTKQWGYTRIIIRDGQIFIRSFEEGFETRNSALIQLLTHAVASWPTSKKTRNGRVEEDRLPPVELILSPGDKDTFAHSGGWSVTKKIDDVNQAGTWLIPDFGFVGWPEAGAVSYQEFLGLTKKVEEQYPWDKKYNRVFWRGFANYYPIRRDLIQRTSTTTDPKREDWADVHETTFHKEDKGDFVPLVSLPDHCQHKYLIHTEGNSYSGRSKYLFSCQSVTVAHPLEWTQHFHPALNPYVHSPNQNFVQLPGPGFEGLEEAVQELRQSDWDHPYSSNLHNYTGLKAPAKIAENVGRTLRDRYLTPAATMCYIRAALRHYANVLNTASWGPEGIQVLPGHGIAPSSSKGREMAHLKGDIEVGLWRLLGGPNWPPGPDAVQATAQSEGPVQKLEAAIVV